MAVITKTIWTESAVASGGIAIANVPDPDAYGLAIYVNSKADVDPTKFYDGTFIIEASTGVAYYIHGGVISPIYVGGGTVGPQGPPGPTGPTGATGAQGPAGPPATVVWQ